MQIRPSEYLDFDFDPPLTSAELEVIEYLIKIDGDWQADIRPKIVFPTPTVVLTSLSFGLIVLNVLPWKDDGSMRRKSDETFKQPNKGSQEIFTADGSFSIEKKVENEWVRININPKKALAKSVSTLFKEKFYTKELDERSNTGESKAKSKAIEVARGVLAIPGFKNQTDAGKLVDLRGLTRKETDSLKVFGHDIFDSIGLRALMNKDFSKYQLQSSIDRIRAELAGPSTSGRVAFVLSGGAKNIAENPNNAKRRRIRGCAGSGKSIGVAARAAHLALEKKEVLIIGYNITLSSYLRDLTRNRLNGLGQKGLEAFHRVTISHFHRFLFDITNDSDSEDSNPGPDFTEHKILLAKRGYEKQKFFEDRGKEVYSKWPRYSAIFVDEGQDFRQTWWDFLRDYVLEEGGEMAVVLDHTQDVYEVGNWSEEMQGFGPWTEIKESFRLSSVVVSLAKQIATDFDLGAKKLLPEKNTVQASLYEPCIRWLNIGAEEINATTVSAVEWLQKVTGSKSLDGTTLLFDQHAMGMRILEALKKIPECKNIDNIFSEDAMGQQDKKKAFDASSTCLKACTVHSYKGWESRNVVYVPTADNPTLLFIAVTRVLGLSEEGASNLIVINSERKFDQYKSFSTHDASGDRKITSVSF